VTRPWAVSHRSRADIAAINRHGLGVGGEGDDTRAVVELDNADFDIFGERGRAAMFIEAIHRQILLTVAGNGSREVENLGEFVALTNVFECALIIFGGKEVIPVFEPEPFANVFEGVGIGPADADRFFGQRDDLLSLVVNGFFGLDPGDLVRQEMFGEAGVGIEFGWQE